MALDNLAKTVRALHEAVLAGRMTREDVYADPDTVSADDILGTMEPRLAKQRIIQVKNALAGAIGGNNYKIWMDGPEGFTVDFDRRREPSVMRVLKSFPWVVAAKDEPNDGDPAGRNMTLNISVNPDHASNWQEALIPSGGTKLSPGHIEAVKKAVDPSHPTEPIEGHEQPAGPEGAKPSFEAMVATAKTALLDRKDPHEAVEQLLGEGEPEDETQIVQAVEAALNMLEIQEKELEPEGGEQA